MLQENRLSTGELTQEETSALSTAAAALSARTSSLIVHPADVERLARMCVRQSRRHSAMVIRMALAASVAYGHDWFPVADVARRLGSSFQERGSIVASRLKDLGIAETRMDTGQGCRRAEARLTLPLVDANHFHGRHSLQLMKDLEAYCRHHPKATPLIALLVVGIRVYGVQTSDALAKFIEPEFDRQRSPCAASRPLRGLAEAGVLTIVLNEAGPTRPFLVFPIDHSI